MPQFSRRTTIHNTSYATNPRFCYALILECGWILQAYCFGRNNALFPVNVRSFDTRNGDYIFFFYKMTAGLINKKQAIKPEKSACNPTISMIWHASNEFLAHYATDDIPGKICSKRLNKTVHIFTLIKTWTCFYLFSRHFRTNVVFYKETRFLSLWTVYFLAPR